MQVLVYSPSGDQAGERLNRSLEEVLPRGTIEIFHEVKSLVRRLRMSSDGPEILIFLPSNRHELFSASPLLTDLRDIRLVLVLPDSDTETISMAHSLRPRFVTDAGGDYSELKEVLKKMTGDPSKH